MNGFPATLQSAFDEYLTALKRGVDGLTTSEVYSQPSPQSNHIGWLVWHMARVEDRWVNRILLSTAEEWNAGGWDKRFGMDPESNGAGQSIEEVKSMPQIPVPDLLEYFDAVRARTNAYLDKLTDGELEREYQHPRFGVVTGSWIVGHIIVEESQHTGQVAFIRGMTHGFGK
ncbi:MAG: DinB family protein [Chloroflexi bacterium]|nr:DinB family protein [Chloroflexota bacterium]